MSTIDPWDEVSTDEDVLAFKDPKQNAKFTLGVRMAIYQWEELNLAGGLVPSRERREYVSGTVLLDLFNSMNALDIDMIDEVLWQSSSVDLDPELESDARLVTGDLIFKMYRECRERDFSRIDEMYRRFQEKQVAEQVKRRKAIEEDSKKDEAESGQTEHNGDESEQTEQNRDESEQTEHNGDKSEQTEQNRDESEQTEQNRDESEQTEQNRDESEQTEHNGGESEQTEHNGDESQQTEHNGDESEQTEQNRDESEQTEQNRDESEQTEHNDVGTNQDIDPKQAVLDEDGFDLVTK